MDNAENLQPGAVDRAPYRLMHLLRQLSPEITRFTAVSESERPTLEAIGEQARNASGTLIHGLGAIGNVLMNAGLKAEGGVEPRHLARLGDLITHMAVEVEAMQELDWSMRDILASRPG